MSARNQQTVNELLERVQANMFIRYQDYGQGLTTGVMTPPDLTEQSVLIFGLSTNITTLAQKNIYADMAAGKGYDRTQNDGLGVIGLFNPNF